MQKPASALMTFVRGTNAGNRRQTILHVIAGLTRTLICSNISHNVEECR